MRARFLSKYYNRLLDNIIKKMALMGKTYGDNTIFVAQGHDNEVNQATVVIGLANSIKGGKDAEYLAVRRLFSALEYRFNQETNDYKLKVSLQRKRR